MIHNGCGRLMFLFVELPTQLYGFYSCQFAGSPNTKLCPLVGSGILLHRSSDQPLGFLGTSRGSTANVDKVPYKTGNLRSFKRLVKSGECVNF